MALTLLDHVREVHLGEDLGHPEHHEGVLGVDQVGTDGPVQEPLEQLGVHEQVLLHEGTPDTEHSEPREQATLRTGAAGHVVPFILYLTWLPADYRYTSSRAS